MILEFINSETGETVGEYKALNDFPVPRVGDKINSMLNEAFSYKVIDIEYWVDTFEMHTNTDQIVLNRVKIIVGRA